MHKAKNIRLIQCTFNHKNAIGLVSDDSTQINILNNFDSIYELACYAIKTKKNIIDLTLNNLSRTKVNYSALYSQRAIHIPIEHKNKLCCYVTGTGLTHANSGILRNDMHKKNHSEEEMTDAQKIYLFGLENGKPAKGSYGSRPEWFFKGNGHTIIPTGHDLPVPSYAQGCGEEAELVGIYIISQEGIPYRVGFSIGNEFSDHVLEKKNFYYLAQSKLFTCACWARNYYR